MPLTLAAAIVLVTGCAELRDQGPGQRSDLGSPPVSPDPTALSSVEAASLATPTAKAWNDDAMLVGLHGIESPSARGDVIGGWEYHTPADALVGDGRLPVWVAIFESSTANETAAFLVPADRKVRLLSAWTPPVGIFLGVPLEPTMLDSQRLAARAREHPDFSDTARREEGISYGTTFGGPATTGDMFTYSMSASAGPGGETGRVVAALEAASGSIVIERHYELHIEVEPGGSEVGRKLFVSPGYEMLNLTSFLTWGDDFSFRLLGPDGDVLIARKASHPRTMRDSVPILATGVHELWTSAPEQDSFYREVRVDHEVVLQ